MTPANATTPPRLSRPKVFQRNRQMVQAYKAGATLDEIGRAHGITGTRVLRILEEWGVDRRPRGGNSPKCSPDSTAQASM